MKVLNISDAKNVAYRFSEQIEPIDLRDFFLVHSEKTGRVAKMIAQKVDIDSDVFEIAGWVHDIGYSKNVENHAQFSLSLLHELGHEIDEILKDCILNHGNEAYPQTTEGKIFQLADKLSIFDSDVIEIMLSHGVFPLKDDDVNFLKTMSNKAFKLLENYSI